MRQVLSLLTLRLRDTLLILQNILKVKMKSYLVLDLWFQEVI